MAEDQIETTDEDAQPLLNVDTQADAQAGEIVENAELATPDAVVRNFVTMAFCFSIVHGVVTALMSLASSVYTCDPDLVNIANGVLFVMYTLSSLLLSTLAVVELGAKTCMNIGLCLYCLYVASFLVASTMAPSDCKQTDPSENAVMRTLVIVAMMISGVGGGLLWTAQGKYFGLSASLYVQRSGASMHEATFMLAATFSGIYLGIEFAMKLLSSLLPLKDNKTLSFTIFTAIAVLAALHSFYALTHLSSGSTSLSMCDKAVGAMTLLRQESRIWLLSPFPSHLGLRSSI